jgi:hypothetical protein
MNRLFLSPAHKDHIFSRWGLPSCRRIKNVRVITVTIINRRRSSQMRLDVKTILTFTFYAHGLTQGEHKEILTGSLQRLEMNIYFIEMS